MNPQESMLLVINTPALWKNDSGEPADVENIIITDRGVSLKPATYYANTGAYAIGHKPVDFALDSCGVYYIVSGPVDGRNSLLIFDRERGSYRQVGCMDLRDASAIAISDSDVLIATENGITSFARANYQVRWEARIPTHEILGIACCNSDKLFLLFLEDNRPLIGEFDYTGVELHPLYLMDASGESYDLVDIAANDNGLYALYRKQGSYGILKIRYGSVQDDILLPLPNEFSPKILAVSRAGDFHVSDGEETYIVSLTSSFAVAGALITRTLDSTLSGCEWHKAVLDTEVIDNTGAVHGAADRTNTKFQLYYCASDNENELNHLSWSKPIINPSDALILDAKGRYIRFKIELFSDDLGMSTPRIVSLKAVFPHLSYLRYLPAVYQEDDAAKEFLRRFLSLFETFFSDLEDKVFSSTRYIDANVAPDEFLPWLAQWLAVSYDESWPAEKVRRLINEAPRLYRMRGTRAGIEAVIKIYLDDDEYSAGLKARVENCVADGGIKSEFYRFCEQQMMIIEGFRTKQCHEDATGPLKTTLGLSPYSFCVLLKPFSVSSAGLEAVRRIVNREKPAHTVGHVRALGPWFNLDGGTFLGINTMLAEPVFVLGESVLPVDTVLSDREQAGQTGVRARIGEDTLIT